MGFSGPGTRRLVPLARANALAVTPEFARDELHGIAEAFVSPEIEQFLNHAVERRLVDVLSHHRQDLAERRVRGFHPVSHQERGPGMMRTPALPSLLWR
jgi:hypothetical protein